MLPDDIILNTRRAFSPDATSATGYGSLGAPEGRYIAPDNSENCVEVRNGDCAPRTLLVRAPWFTRFDVSLSKRFETGSRVNFELRFDVLNVFDNINFDNLHVRRQRGQRRDDLPGRRRLPRPEQHVRSGRETRTDRVENQLVIG